METKPKLDIFRLLNAADLRQRSFYADLTEEEQRGFNPLVAMRWLSTTRHPAEHYLILTNLCVNVDFWALRQHPELQWLLMTYVGDNTKRRHDWIPMAKRSKQAPVEEFIRRWHPALNALEMQIVLDQFTETSFTDFVHATGVEDSEADAVIAAFKKPK